MACLRKHSCHVAPYITRTDNYDIHERPLCFLLLMKLPRTIISYILINLNGSFMKKKSLLLFLILAFPLFLCAAPSILEIFDESSGLRTAKLIYNDEILRYRMIYYYNSQNKLYQIVFDNGISLDLNSLEGSSFRLIANSTMTTEGENSIKIILIDLVHQKEK